MLQLVTHFNKLTADSPSLFHPPLGKDNNLIECWWYERELGSTIELTPHALKRKAERGFTDSDIIKILKYGRQKLGTNQICYRDLYAAVERIGDDCIRIITVCRRGEDLLAA